MTHTLKTLYFFMRRHYPALTGSFKNLKDYCLNDSQKHQLDTLGYVIYKLRFEVSHDELQRIFYYALVEAYFYGEDFLYADMQNFKIWYEYRNMLNPDSTKSMHSSNEKQNKIKVISPK